MPITVVLGLMLIVAGACLFLGAGIGYYNALREQERKQRKLNKQLGAMR